MKATKTLFAVLLAVVILTLGVSPVYARSNPPDDVIIVEVVVGTIEKDELERIEFDDGTTLGDYEYVVIPLLSRRSYEIQMYLEYGAWITRDGVVSLSIQPKDNVRNNRATMETAWSIISSPVSGFGSSSYWQNGHTMWLQYLCHFEFANSKVFWNLEPHRNTSNYLWVVANGCNP